jgi:predicted ArsR family transcriptional regulator
VQNLKKVAVESEEVFMKSKISRQKRSGKEGILFMQKQSFMRADEVAQELGISKSHAYKVIHGLNEELQEKGYLTISGRVNREFFREKYYYTKTAKEES